MIKTKKYTTFIAIVISLFIIVGISIFFKNKIEKHPETNDLGTCKTPQEAFTETQNALNLISENLNIGMKNVQYINEYENTKNKIFKNK